MRNIGINMHAKPGLTDEQYVELAANVGFDSVFAGPWEHDRLEKLAACTAAHGMTVETLHAPFGHINDIWFAGDDGDAMLAELKDCVDGCVAAGAKIAVVHLSSGEAAPPVTDAGRARFETLVAYANQRGVKIAFENQRKLANLAWSMETFTEEEAGFCWDCGHEACFTPGKEFMPLFGERLLCTHIHDNFKRYNEDRHLLPFDGAMDFARVTDLFRQSGYQGTLSLEAITRNSHAYDDMDIETYLSRAATAVKRLRTMLDGE